jgi:hypothetical protein
MAQLSLTMCLLMAAQVCTCHSFEYRFVAKMFCSISCAELILMDTSVLRGFLLSGNASPLCCAEVIMAVKHDNFLVSSWTSCCHSAKALC